MKIDETSLVLTFDGIRGELVIFLPDNEKDCPDELWLDLDKVVDYLGVSRKRLEKLLRNRENFLNCGLCRNGDRFITFNDFVKLSRLIANDLNSYKSRKVTTAVSNLEGFSVRNHFARNLIEDVTKGFVALLQKLYGENIGSLPTFKFEDAVEDKTVEDENPWIDYQCPVTLPNGSVKNLRVWKNKIDGQEVVAEPDLMKFEEELDKELVMQKHTTDLRSSC